MNATLARLTAFFAVWDGQLNRNEGKVTLAAQPLDTPPGVYAACADRFVAGLGYTPIGGNWELLDAEADIAGPRSARAALVEAFDCDMVFPQRAWLGSAGALAMAEDWLACFDRGALQIVTNRMYFGWHPITTAKIEWGFVAFDDTAIALMLATAES